MAEGSSGWRTAGNAVAITVGVILIVAGALWALVAVVRTESFASDTFDGDVARLAVDNSAGRIVVTGGNTDEIRIERTLVSTWGSPDERIEEVGDTLEVHTRCRGGVVWFFGWCSASYEIIVPEGVEVVANSRAGRVEVTDTAAPVDVQSSAGRVEVTGAEGPVRAHSSAGRVLVADVVGPEVDAHSSAGRVEVSNAEISGPLEADSGAGSVSVVSSSAPEIIASSSAGSVEVDTAAPFDSIHAESSAGSVDVVVPMDDGPYRVDASSSAGRTTVDVPSDPRSDEPSIYARSSAGSVTVGGR